MIINEIIGNIATTSINGLETDWLPIEWFETAKRIQRLKAESGMEIPIRFLKEGQRLTQGDIVYKDDKKVVVVAIKPCDAIIISPKSLLEMGTVCYEIGNKHLPIFIQDDQVLVPYEDPLFRWLQASGYEPVKENRQLINMLKSNLDSHGHGHGHGHGGGSLFSKIIGLGK